MDDASPTDEELDAVVERQFGGYLALRHKLNLPPPADLPALRARIKQRALAKRKADELLQEYITLHAQQEAEIRARWEFQSLDSHGEWAVVARRGEVSLESLGAEPIAIRPPAVPFPINRTWDLYRSGGTLPNRFDLPNRW